MATLKQVQNKLETLSGDFAYNEAQRAHMFNTYTVRRGNRSFLVTPNFRTLRSGPNRGYARFDGVRVVLLPNGMRTMRSNMALYSNVVRTSEEFLTTLDSMVAHSLRFNS